MMRIGYWFMLVALSCLLELPTAAWSDEPTRPFWTEQAMFRFGDELFFTGRASCSPRAEEGRQKAYEAAVQEVLNYTQAPRLTGVPIETQMLVEEPGAIGCPLETVTVWRLLRVPEASLDALAKRAWQSDRPSLPETDSTFQAVRDLTLRVGMNREEIHERFGLPRSVIMRRSSRVVQYDYPQFGLMLTVDEAGALLRWRLAAPQSATASRISQGDWLPQPKDPAFKSSGNSNREPTIDLTDRLRQLEMRSHKELKEDAAIICSRRWPRDPTLQRTCEPYEYEHLRHIEGQQAVIMNR
jgi:hypothetical protein